MSTVSAVLPRAILLSVLLLYCVLVNLAGAAAGTAASVGVSSCSTWRAPDALAATWEDGRAALLRGSGSDDGFGGTLASTQLPNTMVPVSQTVPAPQWEASAVLDAQDFRQRRIYTALGAGGAPLLTVPFSWGELDERARASFARGADGMPDALGTTRLDYVRGDRSREIGHPGGVFRARTSIFGAPGHSAPLWVGAPLQRGGDASYAAFFEQHRQRAAVVYMGANDGMLHAFAAIDGRELFAYIPAALLARTPSLSNPSALPQPYVDGQLAAAEVPVAGRWRTLLAGGMGRGASGLFALDVSEPQRFGSGGALFEFTAQDDGDVAYQFGAPQVGRMRDANGTLRDYLFVAGGYRHAAHSAARSALFVLSLDRAQGEPWQLGVNYFKFTLPTGEAPPASFDALDAGLSTPALVAGDDGAVRYAYAGDLQGNLWRFDFAGTAPWGQATPGKPIFIASDAHGVRQPIAQQPQVVFDATEGDDGQGVRADGHLILFGTGKLLEPADGARSGLSTQTLYGVHDGLQKPQAQTRRNLNARTLVEERGELRVVGAPGNARGRGWYLDLAGTGGERSVGRAMLAGRTIVFNTLSFDAGCNLEARAYTLVTLSGLSDDKPAPAEKRVRTVQGVVRLPLAAARQSGPAGSRLPAALHLLVDANGVALTSVAGPAGALRDGRFAWREIANWRERRDALLDQ